MFHTIQHPWPLNTSPDQSKILVSLPFLHTFSTVSVSVACYYRLDWPALGGVFLLDYDYRSGHSLEVAFQSVEKTSWPGLQFFKRKMVDPDFLFSIELATFTNPLKK